MASCDWCISIPSLPIHGISCFLIGPTSYLWEKLFPHRSVALFAKSCLVTDISSAVIGAFRSSHYLFHNNQPMTARLLLRILCTNTNLIFIISNSVPGANKISSMLLNDKVKVSWKTNCQWRDKPRWPKRKPPPCR